LEYHRQLHLQRLAEQEVEMQTRLDQQRRYAQQREQQNQIDYRINQVEKKEKCFFFIYSSFIRSHMFNHRHLSGIIINNNS
jgi:hypothetical protein